MYPERLLEKEMRGGEEKEEERRSWREMPTWWPSCIAPDTPKCNLPEVTAESALLERGKEEQNKNKSL